MHEEETPRLLHHLPRVGPRRRNRGNRRRNDRRARLGQLSSDERNTSDVLGAVGAREAELGGEFGADGFAEEEGYGAATLLVEGYI